MKERLTMNLAIKDDHTNTSKNISHCWKIFDKCTRHGLLNTCRPTCHNNFQLEKCQVLLLILLFPDIMFLKCFTENGK